MNSSLTKDQLHRFVFLITYFFFIFFLVACFTTSTSASSKNSQIKQKNNKVVNSVATENDTDAKRENSLDEISSEESSNDEEASTDTGNSSSSEDESVSESPSESDSSSEEESSSSSEESENDTSEKTANSADVIEVSIADNGITILKGTSSEYVKERRLLKVPYGSAVVLFLKTPVFFNGKRTSSGQTVVWRTSEQEFSVLRVARQQYRLVSQSE